MKPAIAADDHSLTILNEDPRAWFPPVVMNLLRFHGRLERRMVTILGAHGLSQPQFDVLATLQHGDGITQQELAERLLVTKGNVVGIIDRASAAGWLERRPDPEDRRANRIYLTEAGRTIAGQAKPRLMGLFEQIFGTLTAGELHLMAELIRRLEAATTGLKGQVASNETDENCPHES